MKHSPRSIFEWSTSPFLVTNPYFPSRIHSLLKGSSGVINLLYVYIYIDIYIYVCVCAYIKLKSEGCPLLVELSMQQSRVTHPTLPLTFNSCFISFHTPFTSITYENKTLLFTISGFPHVPRVCPMAFSHVSHPKESLQVVTPALRTAANLVTGDDMQTDFFLRSKPWDTWIGRIGMGP